MTARLHLVACALAILSAAGCRHQTITPAPGILPSAGMLVRCEHIPLSSQLELRKYELYHSDLTNDFYPLNISRGKLEGSLLSRLFVWRWDGWQFLDFAFMPRATVFDAPNLGPGDRHIVYECPDVSPGEGEMPRKLGSGTRVHRVVIRHIHTPNLQKITLNHYTEVYGLGMASFWRPDSEAVAFTTTNARDKPFVRELVVLDGAGVPLLDSAGLADLKGLEFIAWSPDGGRIAALLPATPHVRGQDGGKLVEIDVKAKTAKTAGEIPSGQACHYVGRFDKLIRWEAGGLTLKK